MKRKLFKHQLEFFKYARRIKHPAGFLEMRLGKTLVTIRVINTYPKRSRILVVAPSSALGSWERELKLEKEASYIFLTGTREQRLKLLDKGYKWNLLNKEGWQVIPEIQYMDWDVVVIDESTFLKEPTSQVSRFFAFNFRDVPHRWVLTGLPNPESNRDYFMQLLFLDPSILRYKNYWVFRAKEMKPSRYGWELKPSATKVIQERVAERCFIMNRKEVGLHNRKIYEERSIEMPDNIRKIYNQVESEFILNIGKKEKKTIFATTKFHWLRQLCGGYAFNKLIWDGKYQLLKELFNTELISNTKIVWMTYLNELFKMKKQLELIVHGDVKMTDRFEIFKEFQEGRYSCLYCQPECVKYGTDLSRADTQIFFSTPLGNETRMQSEDRLAHPNKKEPILIIDLIVEDSIDRDINETRIQKMVESEAQLYVARQMQRRHKYGRAENKKRQTKITSMR